MKKGEVDNEMLKCEHSLTLIGSSLVDFASPQTVQDLSNWEVKTNPRASEHACEP